MPCGEDAVGLDVEDEVWAMAQAGYPVVPGSATLAPMHRWSTLGLITLAGCGSPRADGAAWPGALCEARLAPLSPTFAGSPLEPLRSRVLIDARIETRRALAELDRALPKRLAERRGVDLGDAGRLSFVIDRGPFAVSVASDELSVSVDLQGQADVCKPLGPLGCVGYASCAPGGRASASLRLLLADDYRMLPSRVQIPVTRPCTLSSLGIDMTAEVQTQANRQADELRRRIDGAMPDLGAVVSSLWRALSATIPLGDGACAQISPRGVLQTGPRLQDDVLTLGLGVEGEIRVETPCQPAASPPPLPPPQLERVLPPGVDLQVPLVTAWPAVGMALTRALAQAEPRAGSEVVHVTDVRAQPAPEGRVALGFTLAGRACGEVWFDAVATPLPDGIALTQLRPAPGEPERARAASPGLDLPALARAVEGRLRVPLPADVSGMHRRIEQLAARLLKIEPADGPLQYEVTLSLEPARVERVVSAREGLAAVATAHGQARVTLRATSPAP